MQWLKGFIALVLRFLFRVEVEVEVEGLEHYRQAGKRVIIVANHTSFLDSVLLSIFLPEQLTFAINTQMAERW